MSPLQEAHRLVHGDRGAAYGHPLDNFTHTAGLWSTAFGWDVTAEQVALAMILVKISRECHAPKADNIVDICGYAETHHMVQQERERRKTSGWSDYPGQRLK